MALLDEAKRVNIEAPLPVVRPVAALKARVWLKQGRLAEALGWAREQGLSVDNEICYTSEFEHITLARVLIAAGKSDREAGSLDQATRLLGRLLQAAETGGRLGSVIEILVLQALAHQAPGQPCACASRRWNAPWPWPSRKATCVSSWMKANRCDC